MKITQINIDQNIIPEYEDWKEQMYAGKSKEERQKMGQFFTPPALSIKMVEKFSDLTGKALDPTCGAGNLLVTMFFAKFQYYNQNCKNGFWNKSFQDCLDEIYGIELDPDILKICHQRMQHLCEFVKNKYKFLVVFNPKHFQLGDALNTDINDDKFWEKDPFTIYAKE